MGNQIVDPVNRFMGLEVLIQVLGLWDERLAIQGSFQMPGTLLSFMVAAY